MALAKTLPRALSRKTRSFLYTCFPTGHTLTFHSSHGILYPRGATVGGSAQLNAMNFALPPDSDWDYIAEITGDDSWKADKMRQHYIDVENCTYVEEGTPGHGFEGYVKVGSSRSCPILSLMKHMCS